MVLDIRQLHITFNTHVAPLEVVRGVNLTVNLGEIVGLVGESGSGKSATAQAIMQLLQDAEIRGKILFHGEDLLAKSPREIEAIRGSQIGMMFQDSNAALNPTMSIGDQITEGLLKHRRLKRGDAFQKGVEMLFNLGVNNPVGRMNQFAHELSGGIRQRIMLAIAMACGPDLIIADEPTTAVDVITQAQILQLLKNLHTSILFITHDLNLISKIADRIYVMYAGKIVESSHTQELFESPKHPYTKALLESTPNLAGSHLKIIEGSPPSPFHFPSGCAFHPRCPDALQICSLKDPDGISLNS